MVGPDSAPPVASGRTCDVDGRFEASVDSPKPCRGRMTRDGAGATGQDRREAPTMIRERPVSEGVGALMNSVQAAGRSVAGNCCRRIAKASELSVGDDSVLGCRQRCQSEATGIRSHTD